jgi:hypothetical protein
MPTKPPAYRARLLQIAALALENLCDGRDKNKRVRVTREAVVSETARLATFTKYLPRAQHRYADGPTIAAVVDELLAMTGDERHMAVGDLGGERSRGGSWFSYMLDEELKANSLGMEGMITTIEREMDSLCDEVLTMCREPAVEMREVVDASGVRRTRTPADGAVASPFAPERVPSDVAGTKLVVGAPRPGTMQITASQIFVPGPHRLHVLRDMLSHDALQTINPSDTPALRDFYRRCHQVTYLSAATFKAVAEAEARRSLQLSDVSILTPREWAWGAAIAAPKFRLHGKQETR